MSIAVPEVLPAHRIALWGRDGGGWLSSCLVCGLIGDPRARDLGALAAVRRDQRCPECGGRDLWFIWAGP